VIVVEEVERGTAARALALELEVERRRTAEAERSEYPGNAPGVRSTNAWSARRLLALVDVEPSTKFVCTWAGTSGAGDWSETCCTFSRPLRLAVFDCCPLVPGLDAGEHRLEAVALQPLQMRLGEERQAALRDEVDAVRRPRPPRSRPRLV